MVRILEEYNFSANELCLLKRKEMVGAPIGFKDQVLTTWTASKKYTENSIRHPSLLTNGNFL